MFVLLTFFTRFTISVLNIKQKLPTREKKLYFFPKPRFLFMWKVVRSFWNQFIESVFSLIWKALIMVEFSSQKNK